MLAKSVLVWIANAARSMTVEELRRAVATSPGSHHFERKRLVPAPVLLTLCHGLVVVEEETKFVRLVRTYTTVSVLGI